MSILDNEDNLIKQTDDAVYEKLMSPVILPGACCIEQMVSLNEFNNFLIFEKSKWKLQKTPNDVILKILIDSGASYNDLQKENTIDYINNNLKSIKNNIINHNTKIYNKYNNINSYGVGNNNKVGTTYVKYYDDYDSCLRYGQPLYDQPLISTDNNAATQVKASNQTIK